jgi:hypothetical protein
MGGGIGITTSAIAIVFSVKAEVAKWVRSGTRSGLLGKALVGPWEGTGDDLALTADNVGLGVCSAADIVKTLLIQLKTVKNDNE